MAGHSKWANIKHRKGAADAKRGKVFSKIAKEISVAARIGGGDPGANPTLRTIIQKARSVNMPADNIDRAIKKGTGEAGGEAPIEVFYEGYAPGGIALLVQCLTDNRNRTAAEVRFVFSRHNGSLGSTGSTARLFDRKGLITVARDAVSEDRLIEACLEAGADDVQTGDTEYEIHTSPSDFMTVVDALAAAEIPIQQSEVTMLPLETTEVTDRDAAEALVKFIEALEDLDDVQSVYAAFDLNDELIAGME